MPKGNKQIKKQDDALTDSVVLCAPTEDSPTSLSFAGHNDNQENAPIQTRISWNRPFTKAVIQLETKEKEGHLGQWEYSLPDPEIPGDPVRGSELWQEFLENNPNYYIMTSEKELVEKAASLIPNLVEQPVAFALLGIGTVDALKNKDFKIVEQFTHVTNITAFDISEQYLQDGFTAIKDEFPKPNSGIYNTDFFKDGFEATRGRIKNTRLVATMFGATLFNVEAERDELGNLVTPESQVRAKLRKIRESLEEGDLFITTHDGNMGKEKVEGAYCNQTEFATNLAHRIKRDTPYKNIDTSASKFRVEFDEKSGVLGHYLTFDFDGDGKIEEYLFNISLKVPEDKFLKWCREEGFKVRLSEAHNGMHLHALEAVEMADDYGALAAS